jgi:hypothetical protein
VLLTRSRKPHEGSTEHTPQGGNVVLKARADDARQFIEVEDECGGIPDGASDPFQARENGRADVVAELIPVLPLKLTAPCLRISCATVPAVRLRRLRFGAP